MFFVVWGSRGLRLTIGTGTFFCPKCRISRPFNHKQIKRFFTLYYIPLIPISDGQEYVECQHCKGTFRSDVLKIPTMPITYSARHPILMGYGIVAALICVFMVFASLGAAFDAKRTAQEQANAENARLALIANFGNENLQRCGSVGTSAQWAISPNARVLMVNQTTQTIMDNYQQQVPASVRATSKQNLTHVFCLSPSYTAYARDTYGSKSEGVVYTCTRYRRSLEVRVVEVKTGRTTSQGTFQGPIPPECPASTDQNTSVYGDDPNLATLMTTLHVDPGA